MAWTEDNFPPIMKNLLPTIREKAIDLANGLVEEGFDTDEAIPTAIVQAKEWAVENAIAAPLDGEATGPETLNIDDSDEENIYTNVAGVTREQ